jgi:hypothetical protein
MISDQKLIDKARDAASDYRSIYGEYPSAIGIDHRRLSEIQVTHLNFPVIPELASIFTMDITCPAPALHMVRVQFLPYAGGLPDEVYMPRHGRAKDDMVTKGVRGAMIARWARMIESRRERQRQAQLYSSTQYHREFYGAFIG